MLSQELRLIPGVGAVARLLWESKRVHTDLVVIKDDLQGKASWPVFVVYKGVNGLSSIWDNGHSDRFRSSRLMSPF